MTRISTLGTGEGSLRYGNADIDASPFPFFKLPPEIRNAIYRLSSQTIYSHKRYHTPLFINDSRRRQQMAYNNSCMIKQPALFHSCSLARSEGLPLYYRECKHIFEREYTGESDKIILDWLRAIIGRGFRVQRLHILTAYPCNYLGEQRVSSNPIGSPLRTLTKEIYSILHQNITLYYSDYYRSAYLNEVLVGLASYIHSLRDWLSGNGADAPVFIFRETSPYNFKEAKTLSHAQRLHRTRSPVFKRSPATLIASSQNAYYLAHPFQPEKQRRFRSF